ncbi:MAG: UDP-2,4-diacetamido-2,4,6-trideoxy-beta-L-altropyranose hydrolase [Lachnospiraceae bacterium]|nr:UDP-2,4-diacetamido-2,4,6-trideoxy-beta-L-altropyranose hydrolase [Lachnospiraceae bacterium]
MILIRADANEQIGTGHVMRCLSVAEALREKGEEVRFLTADHRGDGLITARGFETVCMDSGYTRMEEEPVLPVIRELAPGLLLTDSYYVTPGYFAALEGSVRTVYVDDGYVSFGRPEGILNYQIYADPASYDGYEEDALILGPSYAPLREAFRKLPPRQTGPVREVLITAGGSDPERISVKLLRELVPGRPGMHFHLVVGALNPALEGIRELADHLEQVTLHVNERDMAGLMRRCDLAVSAAGSTLYELCACGTPAVIFALADNQLPAVRAFAEQELMVSAGDCRGRSGFVSDLCGLFDELAADEQKRADFSKRMQERVDGCGAKRIAERLLASLC